MSDNSNNPDVPFDLLRRPKRRKAVPSGTPNRNPRQVVGVHSCSRRKLICSRRYMFFMTQASSSSDVAAPPSPCARPNISYMSVRRKSRFYLTFQALHSRALIMPVCSCIPLYSFYTRNLSVNPAEADPRRGLPPSNGYDSHKSQKTTTISPLHHTQTENGDQQDTKDSPLESF